MIKVLLVDDHILFREGLAILLGSQPDFNVVAQAGSIQKAVALAFDLQPDLILMDISLPDGLGSEAVRMILSEWPEASIVMVTNDEADEDLAAAIRSGSKGYTLRDTPVAKLLTYLRSLALGDAPSPVS